MKCLLVDDHTIFREALAMLMSHRHPDVRLVSAGSLKGALQQLESTPDIDLVLLDLNLPDSQGVETLTRLLELAPDPRVIVLSADERPETVLAAIDAGAAGFIPKTADFAALDGALKTVVAGGVYIPSEVHASVSAESPVHAPEDPSLGLTVRQLDVFRLLIEGKANKRIALMLGLTESTVKTHVQAIFDRLHISTRGQAVLVAARMGWRLPPPQS